MREQYKRFIIGNMDLLRSKDFEQFNTKVYEVREEFNLSRLAITELYEYLYLDKKIDVLSGNATFVPNSFMYYSKEITSIVIPDNIKAIQGSAFAGCEFLEKVTFGTNVSTIGRNAFDNCPSLKELYLPEGVTVIGLNAFTSCTKLKKLLLPNSEKLRFFMEHEGLEKYVDDPSIIEWY